MLRARYHEEDKYLLKLSVFALGENLENDQRASRQGSGNKVKLGIRSVTRYLQSLILINVPRRTKGLKWSMGVCIAITLTRFKLYCASERFRFSI